MPNLRRIRLVRDATVRALGLGLLRPGRNAVLHQAVRLPLTAGAAGRVAPGLRRLDLAKIEPAAGHAERRAITFPGRSRRARQVR